MIPITADYDNFEVMNVKEFDSTNLLSAVIKVGEQIGRAQFLSGPKFIENNGSIELFNGKERDILTKIVDKINTKAGDDIILNTRIKWNDIIKLNKEFKGDCEIRLLWNVIISHTILPWDKSCSSTPGKTTFTLNVNLLNVLYLDN